MPKDHLRFYSRRPNKSKAKVDLFCCLKAKVDDNTSARDTDTKCYECIQAPKTASNVSFSNENQAELSRMSLENATVTEKPKEPNSSTPQDGCISAVGNSQTESSRGSPTDLHKSRNMVKIKPAPWQVRSIQAETIVGQPVKESAMHNNPSSRGVRTPIQLNKVAQPVKEIEMHINPPSGGVQKSIRQNKVAPPVKESEMLINPPSDKVQKSIKQNKFTQAVKESDMHANPPSKRVRKSIKQNKAAQPVKENEMHINPPSNGVQKSKEKNKVAEPVKESEIHINPPFDGVRKSIEQSKVALPVKESEIPNNPPSNEVPKSIQQNKASQPIKSSGANKTVRKVNPQKGWRVKEGNEAAKSSQKPRSKPEAQRQETTGSAKCSPKPSSKPEAQRHHIKWHGFDESIGWSCFLCENDLAHSPTEEDEYETDKFPDVAVLSCGHAFHDVCLQLSISELQCSDPPCIICASLVF
ncbi:hypothetical protein HS088_TW23G00624 [Tripterygium wilfordii]|uniref:RING-type domain-containing protein n=1 Tax=Tripterygium wilfordii TaxID=458696 RepID=A0A7J7BVG9_TRIWF|nr:muscle M-line assembly protein unc-89-like [Tripterygium wilfordii]KAF5725892.1 hypothetical protein HS088_TW23G00624 [Tripterygium wilfordii]